MSATSQTPTKPETVAATHTFQFGEGATGNRIYLKRSWSNEQPTEDTEDFFDYFVGVLEHPGGSIISLVTGAFWWNSDHFSNALLRARDHGIHVPLFVPDQDSSSGVFLHLKSSGVFGIYFDDPHRWSSCEVVHTRNHEIGMVDLNEAGTVLRCEIFSLDYFLQKLKDGPFVLPPALTLI